MNSNIQQLTEMKNYFNTLTSAEKLTQLGQCSLLEPDEFRNQAQALVNQKIVIIGCGAQGLNQGLNLRDSGLQVAYALRASAIEEQRQSYLNATENGFAVGQFSAMIPDADLVINLTPDKQHTAVINEVVPLMKQGATLSYSHGFNIVEEGIQIRSDITVIMVAPKSPGSEVRAEYTRGFGVPTLIAVHPENDPEGKGFELAKAYALATGGHRAGVLHSSFVAEVKSDLMGEQTILCGLLQAGSILAYNKMIESNIQPAYASNIVQKGWEVITEALKHGGITLMMDRLSNPAKIKAFTLSEELKHILKPLFEKHMEAILSGQFSAAMMVDWTQGDQDLLRWREATRQTAFEQATSLEEDFLEQEYFDLGTLMVAFVKAGVELAFDTMTNAGIKPESAYYESLHETPLIANTIARKKLFEMNRIISDTAEYGCYLFDNACRPLLNTFMQTIDLQVIGRRFTHSNQVDNQKLLTVNQAIRNHPVETVGKHLRAAMTAMANA